MKKINAEYNKSDRVVCVMQPEYLAFYFQPNRSRERIWLLNTKDRPESVFEYFRTKGVSAGGNAYSLTIRELYAFKEYYNSKLTALMKRLPNQLEYALREYGDLCKTEKESGRKRKPRIYTDRESRADYAA